MDGDSIVDGLYLNNDWRGLDRTFTRRVDIYLL